MPKSKSETKTPTTRLVGFALVIVAGLVGGVASIYSLISYISYRRGGELPGFCDVDLTFNCRGVFDSQWAELAGVPLTVFTLSFFVAMVLLALRAGPVRDDERNPAWAIVVVGYLGALAFGAYLYYVMAAQLDSFCPTCLAIDCANLLGLVGALLAVGGGPAVLGWSVKNLSGGLVGGSGVAFALTFGACFLVTALVASSQIGAEEDEQPVPPAEAYNIVEGYPARYEVVGWESAPVRGNPDAPVIIIEFSDFECPFCQRYSGVLEDLLEAHPDLVQVRFMHFPLHDGCNPHFSQQVHASACNAARAAVCAQDQGRFWELHDLMFANNSHLDRASIFEMVSGLRLDPDEFQACFEMDYSLERVRQNAVAGHDAVTEAGVGRFGTPFSFVNGLLVRGARRLNELEALVVRETQVDEGTGDSASSAN